MDSSSAVSSCPSHSWIHVLDGCVCCSFPGINFKLVLTHCALLPMARPLCLPLSIGVASEHVPRIHLKVSHQLAAVHKPTHLGVATSASGTLESHTDPLRLSQTCLAFVACTSHDESGTRNTSVSGSELDCLNPVQHLQPRCPGRQIQAQPLQHVISHLLTILRPPSKSHLLPQEIHRKDGSSEQVPRRRSNFPQACPNDFGATTSRKRFKTWCSPSEEKTVVLILKRHNFQHALLTHDAQAEERYEPNAFDFTIRSLLTFGPADIFVLYVAVRLPEQPSGSSTGLPKDPTLLWVLFGSSVPCADHRNLLPCFLLLSKTTAPEPSYFLQISHI